MVFPVVQFWDESYLQWTSDKVNKCDVSFKSGEFQAFPVIIFYFESWRWERNGINLLQIACFSSEKSRLHIWLSGIDAHLYNSSIFCQKMAESNTERGETSSLMNEKGSHSISQHNGLHVLLTLYFRILLCVLTSLEFTLKISNFFLAF